MLVGRINVNGEHHMAIDLELIGPRSFVAVVDGKHI
jgi:hypothetical protein